MYYSIPCSSSGIPHSHTSHTTLLGPIFDETAPFFAGCKTPHALVELPTRNIANLLYTPPKWSFDAGRLLSMAKIFMETNERRHSEVRRKFTDL